ncbi:YggS family pyridoxal phosphate-dependent enzyme [Luedemannella flava]|uniref:Pyridoxal phosphate homeostasis protein n=1 Tax=Luedemannella flava TaxID=349316 RepID=A0ABN2MC50_9ACTN
MSAAGEARRAELADNLARVRAAIGAGCAEAGRDPGEVTLVAVTKTYPASDVCHLVALGVTDVGENRDQEAAPKAAEAAAAGAAPRWHFVGQLQRNKCASVVGYADAVHSVDSVRLAEALGRAAGQRRDADLDVFVQISLDGDPTRGGAVAPPAYVPGGPVPEPDHDLERVAAAVAAGPRLRLRGVMAVAPLGWQPARAFTLLADIAARLRVGYPTATAISAGMSGDLRDALAHGATHVRIGGALLGNRPPLR